MFSFQSKIQLKDTVFSKSYTAQGSGWGSHCLVLAACFPGSLTGCWESHTASSLSDGKRAPCSWHQCLKAQAFWLVSQGTILNTPPQKKSLKTSRRLHQRLIEGENKLGMTTISFVFLRSHSAGYQLLQWLVQSQISHTNTQCLEPGQLQHSAEQKFILEMSENLQLKAIWILPWVCGEVKAKGLERDRKSILCLVLEAYW